MAWSPAALALCHLSSTPLLYFSPFRTRSPLLEGLVLTYRSPVITILGGGGEICWEGNPIRKGPKVCPDKQINAISTGRVWWPCVWKQSPFPGRVAGLPVRTEQGARSGKQERNLISDLRVCIAVYQSEPSQPELNPPPFSTPSVRPWATRTRSLLRPIQSVFSTLTALFSINVKAETYIYIHSNT